MDVVKYNLENVRLYDEGYESHIYTNNNGILLKRFKSDDKKVLENKIKKIELLKELEDITKIKIIALGEENGIINSYLMEEKKGYTKLNIYAKRKEKIEKLNKLKEYLEELHKNGIVYGDLNSNNILTNGEDICCCDLDNMMISGLSFDVRSNVMRDFLRYKEASVDLDYYMFNIYTIGHLTKYLNEAVLFNLMHKRLPFYLNNKENREIAESMILLKDDNYKKLILDNIKRYHF